MKETEKEKERALRLKELNSAIHEYQRQTEREQKLKALEDVCGRLQKCLEENIISQEEIYRYLGYK